MADEKCYALGTGGWPSKKPPDITAIDLDIRDIVSDLPENRLNWSKNTVENLRTPTSKILTTGKLFSYKALPSKDSKKYGSFVL